MYPAPVPRNLNTTLALCSALACSPTEATTPATPATPAKPVTPAPPPVTPPAPGPAEDCLRDAPDPTDAPARTWQLVGTSREQPFVHAPGPITFVSAGPRLHEMPSTGAAIQPSTHAAGLPRKPVVQMFGSWPDAAFATTREGEAEGGGQSFHVWRWQTSKWVKQTREPLFGDGVPPVYAWTPGRALELRCGDRPGLGFAVIDDDGPSPAPLERAGATSFCPEAFLATTTGDLHAIDHVAGDPLTVRVVHRCSTCTVAETTTLPVPHRCDRPAATTTWGLLTAQQQSTQPVTLAMHTSARDDKGDNQQTGGFLLRRSGDAWTPELVPGAGSIAAFTFAADGTLWLTNDRLLQRSPDGAWRRQALPPAVAASDLRSVVPVGAELWLVTEANLDDKPIYSVYRSGAATTAVNLDTGKPLAI